MRIDLTLRQLEAFVQVANAGSFRQAALQLGQSQPALSRFIQQAEQTLATRLFEKGDIDRAYSYISYALNDANFYNSRFKNTVIARLYPIIESSYLYKLDKQRHNLRFYSTMSSLLVLALAIALFFYFRQTKVISRARRELAALTQELISLNRNLDEANLVKERYLGYFMNQCAIYINKLDKYRRDINLKIRNKQFDPCMTFRCRLPAGRKRSCAAISTVPS